MNQKKIFISYSWTNSNIADQIEKDLSYFPISFVRDIHDIEYKSSISNFMQEIRNCDFAVLLISEHYLKSRNCMIEILHILKEQNFDEKILPIIINSPSIYSSETRISYTKYWIEEENKLNNLISSLPATAILKAIEKLKEIEEIVSKINDFLVHLSDIKNITFDDIKKENYKSIIEKIGGVDVSPLIELLAITMLKDINKKDTLIDKWFDENKPNSEAYSIKAEIAKCRGNFDKAKYNYIKAIELNEENFIALNNYGFLLSQLKENLDDAKLYFEKAIDISPNLTEARLNLGVLLSSHFKDYEGAKNQYEEIIKYNPLESKAYNNLANYYKFKSSTKDNNYKVCYLYEKAITINPDYFEARLSYGSFLSEKMGLHDYALIQYAEMLRIRPESFELIDSLKLRLVKISKIKKCLIGRNDLCFCGSGKKFKKCHGK